MAQNKHSLKQLLFLVLSLLLVIGWGRAAAAASSSSGSSALQAVVQSYTAQGTLQKGMVVKLLANDATKVEADSLSNVQKMTGVVVAPSDAPVTLTTNNQGNNVVYVATSGRYEVLVSDQNGPIATGDYITISSLVGVAMKADNKENEILGRAAGSFDGKHGVQTTTSVKNPKGKTVSVNITRLPVDIAIGPNPIALKVANVPGFLQRAALLIANKPVSAWRIYTGLAMVCGTILVAGALLYAGVRNGMVAIGRNPLARSSIMRNLFQVILTSVIILSIGLFTVYLLLKL